MFRKIKYWTAKIIKQHPYTMFAVWNMLPQLKFLLPHDKSYFGLTFIATKSTGLFLDIGANNGISAAGFRKLNDSYEILSLEASTFHKPALARLKETISRFDYKILAVGSQAGHLTLITPIYKGTPLHTHTSTSLEYLRTSLGRDYSKRVVRSITMQEHSVQTITVDQLNLQPDIVKIDVEGFDFQVLLGMQETVERYRPFFLIEFTPNHMQDFFDYFSQRHYLLFVFNIEQSAFLRFDYEHEKKIWETDHLQVNIYCIPSEKLSSLPHN